MAIEAYKNCKAALVESIKVAGQMIIDMAEDIAGQSDYISGLIGIRDSVLDLCPNKKVVHLARHGRNKKIRKKNFHRAIRILEEL